MGAKQEAEVAQAIKTMITDCAKDEKGQILSCVLETIEAIPSELGDLRPRLVLFTQEGCPVCDEDKERYADMLASKRIVEIRADTPEGAGIMDKLQLPEVPTLAVLDPANNLLLEILEPGS